MSRFLAHWCGRMARSTDFDGMAALLKLARRPYAAEPEPDAQCEAGIGHHGLVGVGQQRQIRRGVADVIEFAWTKTGAQAVELAVAREVGGAVRAQHIAEDAQMIGNAAGKREIRAGSQVDGAPLRCAAR